MPHYFNYLPNRILPIENESLPSYILRLTEANLISHYSYIVPEIFKNFKNPNFAMDIRGPWIEGELFDYPLIELGMGLDIKDLLCCTFYNLYNNIDRNYKWFSYLTSIEKNNYFIEHSFLECNRVSVCPLCLSEYGFINKYWSVKKGTDIICKLINCPIHNIPLINHCPNCKNDFSYENFLYHLHECKFCGFEFSNYITNIDYESGWVDKGNFLIYKIIDSEGVDLPYLPEEKDKLLYIPWRDKIYPFHLHFWFAYYKLCGMRVEFQEYFYSQIKIKSAFEIELEMLGIGIWDDFNIEFGYRVYHGSLKNQSFFQSYTGLSSFSNVIMEITKKWEKRKQRRGWDSNPR